MPQKPKTKRACPTESCLSDKQPRRRRASALLLTTILLFIILSMVVSLTYVTVMEQKMSQKTKSSVGSFFTAESGVEWALNQIATGSGDTINSKFGTQATNATNEGKITCPFSSDCNIYLLDSSGNVIPKYQFGNPNSANLVKAVRSVGSQNQETQRAIEAAVAGGGGMCYTDYALLTADLANGTPCTISGFTIKGSLGRFGMCGGGSSCVGCAGPVAYWLPPGSNCPSHGNVGSYSPSYAGTAYLCCQ